MVGGLFDETRVGRCRFSVLWINDLVAAVNRDEQMAHRGGSFSADVLVGFGETEYLLMIREGKIPTAQEGVELTKPWDFSLRGTKAAWAELLAPVPPPGRQSIFALMKSGDLRIEGDLKCFMQHVWAVLRLVELMRVTPEQGTNGAY